MSEKKKINEKAIRIIWGSAEDLPALYANNLYISHGGENEFHLFFGHLTPPITHGLTEDEMPDNVEIKPVAKIVVTPEMMGEFLQVLNDNYEKLLNKKEGKK
ncbi:MAG: hypothetical protein H8D87_00130 [Deltaproteobacteria bacterium]|nr:hypothetical protein [Candidatus Desulfobacula maris]